MSIGPIPALAAVSPGQFDDASPGARNSQPGSSQQAAARSSQPDPGDQPKPDTRTGDSASSSFELPQDEVQVLRDSQIQDQVVVKYVVAATGSVILQVPSDQVLDVARGIYQEFVQQAKAGDAAIAARGEDSYGR